MIFRPVSPYKNVLIYAAIGFGLTGLGWWLAQRLPAQPISAALFWSGCLALAGLGLGLYCLYLAFAWARLTYYLDRNGLQIRWGGTIRRIPIGQITSLAPVAEADLPAKQFLNLPLPDWFGGRWAGVTYYTTVPRQDALVAQTASDRILLSPADPQAFVRAWQLRLPLGPTHTWSQSVLRWPIFNYPFWFDVLTWRLVGGAGLVYLILLGATLTAYPAWPETIVANFNLLSAAKIAVSREQVLWLPAVGGIILVVNLLLGASWYQKDRLAAYLIWGLTLLIQASLWVAIRSVVN